MDNYKPIPGKADDNSIRLILSAFENPTKYRSILLTDNQIHIVKGFINKKHEMTVKQFAAYKQISASNASVILSNLYKKGYLERLKLETQLEGFTYKYRARIIFI